MNIVVAHNFYQQPGGEDEVFASEVRLLRSRGHRVTEFTAHNDEVASLGRAAVAAGTVWNRRTAGRLRDLVRAERPEVVHFHNTFPLMSPAVYAAARGAGCAVVQTLHNYRLACPGALFFRGERACEACLGRRVAWPGVWHKCYRGSRSATAVVAAMLAVHHAAGTYRRLVDAYITPSQFARDKLARAGLPADALHVKPHFLDPDPGEGTGAGGFALFVGRFSPGKGLDTLLAAWPRLSVRVPLKVIGDGDLAPLVVDAAARTPGVEWLGRKPPEEVYAAMGAAAFLVLPSECYETFGRVVIEAYAKATPVIAADHGAAAELVTGSGAGRLFRAGDPADLARAVDSFTADPKAVDAMRPRARAEFEAKYTGDRNYEMLMAVYRLALARARGRAYRGKAS